MSGGTDTKYGDASDDPRKRFLEQFIVVHVAHYPALSVQFSRDIWPDRCTVLEKIRDGVACMMPVVTGPVDAR